jgi:hypothetical protein
LRVSAKQRKGASAALTDLQATAKKLGQPNLYVSLVESGCNPRVRSILDHQRQSLSLSSKRGTSPQQQLHDAVTGALKTLGETADSSDHTAVDPVVVMYHAPSTAAYDLDPKAPAAQLQIVAVHDDRSFTKSLDLLGDLFVLASDGKLNLIAADLAIVVINRVQPSPENQLHPHGQAQHRSVPIAIALVSKESASFYRKL